MKKHTKKQPPKLVWRSFEQVFSKVLKNKEFRAAYEKETVRLRLAAQLRQLRQAKRLTQQAVAKEVGTPQSVIARLESGRQSVSLDTLARVAHVLGKQVELV